MTEWLSALVGALLMDAAEEAFPPLNEPPTSERLAGKFIWTDLFTTGPMAATKSVAPYGYFPAFRLDTSPP